MPSVWDFLQQVKKDVKNFEEIWDKVRAFEGDQDSLKKEALDIAQHLIHNAQELEHKVWFVSEPLKEKK